MSEFSSPPAFPPQPPPAVRTRRGPGCLSIGCLILVIVLVLLGAGFGGMYWLVSEGGRAFVSEQQAPVRIAEATDEQYQAVLAKLGPFSQAVTDGHAANLELTPDDLNVLIARSPQFESLRGRVFLTAKGDQIVADMSTPLGEDNNRHVYFSGRATLDASYASSGFVVFLRSVEPLDHARADTRFARMLNHPALLNAISQLMSAGLNDGIRQQAVNDTATAELLRTLHTIIVQDGKIVVTTNERPGVTPTPTPVATDGNDT